MAEIKYPLTPEERHQKDLEALEKLRPLDDTFMRELFRNDLELAQFMLRIILSKPDLILTKEETQYDLQHLYGNRSVTLDVFGIDSEGRQYDCEVQKADEGADPKRARYHSAAMDVDNLEAKGKKYALVMDNAPWHKKTKRLICDEALPEYADILKDVVFIKLPPYSPDLNPIEQVWRITRRENTHNIFFASISILELTIDQAFNSWAAPNDQFRTLCCFK